MNPLPPPAPRRPRPPMRTLLVLGALLAVLFGGAAPASAHAALLGTSPGDGTTVPRAPARVTLTFSEGVLVSADSLRVLGPDGTRADTGTPRGNGSTASVALRSGLSRGTFTVAWKVVSADSHPVGGAFTFNIGAASKTAAVVPQPDVGGGLAGGLYGVFRFIAYAGFALLVGASAFLGSCWPRGAQLSPMRRLTVSGWAAMVVSTLALLMLRGPYVEGGGLGEAFDLATLQGQLDTKPGAALLARLLLLAAGAVFMAVFFGSRTTRDDPVELQGRARGPAWGLAIGGTVIAAGLAATWALAEHASVGLQPGIAMPVDILHLLAMALWLGGLAALLTALFSGLGVEREAVRRFSRIAFCAVVTLVATGSYQSWRQLGSWSAFTGTGYGRLLLVKIGLVLLLLELAWLSRRWTARLADPRTATAAAAPAAAASGAPPVPAPSPAGAGAGRVPDPLREAQLARQLSARTKAAAKQARAEARDADPDRRGLRRSVLAEVAVAAAVLAVTTVLSTTQPGRADAAAAAAARAAKAAAARPAGVAAKLRYDTGGPAGTGTAAVTIDPARAGGTNVLHLSIDGSDGRPRDIPQVSVSFTLAAKKIGPLPVALDHTTTGHWASDRVSLPIAGEWTLSVTVRTSDIDEITETKTVKIS